MAKRKMFSVEGFKQSVNEQLQFSINAPAYRQGLIDSLTNILHTTGNYAGYQYLQWHEVPANELPGIQEFTAPNQIGEEHFENTDPTRIRFL